MATNANEILDRLAALLDAATPFKGITPGVSLFMLTIMLERSRIVQWKVGKSRLSDLQP